MNTDTSHNSATDVATHNSATDVATTDDRSTAVAIDAADTSEGTEIEKATEIETSTRTSTASQKDRAARLAERYDDPDPVPTWDEVATEYGPRVYAMAYHLTGDRHEAEDLAQDVFVRVYRNLDKYSPGTFDGWLYRITKNLFLDGIRRRRKVRMVPLPDDDWHGSMEDGPNPEEIVDRHGIDGDIEHAITELPKTFRTAVVLCDVQGMTYEEIAEATGWPMGTVRSRIHRGRRMLRDALTGD